MKGRVLVMDDEVALAELIRFWLDSQGFDVVLAYDGESAVRAYEEGRARENAFDVVLLDLIVPNGLGGQATLQRLRALHPGVKAIVCSGYSHDPVMALYDVYGFDGIVPKPFSLAGLAEEVERVISLPPHGSRP